MEYKDLSAEEFKATLENSKDAEVIDVRTPEEKSEGDIDGSRLMNIMDADFAMKVESLDKNKEYFVFCRSGGRSGSACQYMANKGYKCYNLMGGIVTWNSKFNS